MIAANLVHAMDAQQQDLDVRKYLRTIMDSKELTTKQKYNRIVSFAMSNNISLVGYDLSNINELKL